jgi:hypothetical protein
VSSFVARIRSFLRAGRRGDRRHDNTESELRLPQSVGDRGGEASGRGAFSGLRFSVLDLRLGGRMLVKHPALTAIATIAVAFAIAVGTVGFEIARQALWPTIPLP